MILIKKPKKGDNYKTFFAWFPVYLNGEMRWLEEVTVFWEVFGSDDLGYWKENKRFVDKKSISNKKITK